MPRCERLDYFILLTVIILLTGFSFILIACVDSNFRLKEEKDVYPKTIEKLLSPLKKQFAKMWSSELNKVENITQYKNHVRSKRNVDQDAIVAHSKKHSLSWDSEKNPSSQILHRITFRKFINSKPKARYINYYPQSANIRSQSYFTNKIVPRPRNRSKLKLQDEDEDDDDNDDDEGEDEDVQDNKSDDRSGENWISKGKDEEKDDKDQRESKVVKNNPGTSPRNMTRQRYEVKQQDEHRKGAFSNIKFDLSDMIHKHKEPLFEKTQESDHLCYSALEMILAAAGAVAITTVTVMLIVSCCICCCFRKRKYHQPDFHPNSWWEDGSDTELNYERNVKQQPLIWGGQDNPVAFEHTTYTQLENNKPFEDLILDTNKKFKDEKVYFEKKDPKTTKPCKNVNSKALLQSKTETAIITSDG